MGKGWYIVVYVERCTEKFKNLPSRFDFYILANTREQAIHHAQKTLIDKGWTIIKTTCDGFTPIDLRSNQ